MRMDRQQQDTHQPGRERQKLVHIAACVFGHCSGMALFFKFHHGHKEALPICWSSMKLLITYRRIPKRVRVRPAHSLWEFDQHSTCGCFALCQYWVDFQHYVFLVWYPGWMESSSKTRPQVTHLWCPLTHTEDILWFLLRLSFDL